MDSLQDSFIVEIGAFEVLKSLDLNFLEKLGIRDVESIEMSDLEELEELEEVDEVDEVEVINVDGDYDTYKTDEMQQMREINQNSDENEKPIKVCNSRINVEFRRIEMCINTSTVEEMILKKHRVEIINKQSRNCVMEGVIVGYQLVGRSYDPDIVLEFEDGRSFYNDNFGYLLLFYI
jgi:hypothetical protein